VRVWRTRKRVSLPSGLSAEEDEEKGFKQPDAGVEMEVEVEVECGGGGAWSADGAFVAPNSASMAEAGGRSVVVQHFGRAEMR
jgi:hypothetical protein